MTKINSIEAYRKIALAIIIQALRDVRPLESLSRYAGDYHVQKNARTSAIEFFKSGGYKDLCDNIGLPQSLIYQCYVARLNGAEMSVQMP